MKVKQYHWKYKQLKKQIMVTPYTSILFQYIFSFKNFVHGKCLKTLSMNKIRFRYSCYNVSDKTVGVEVGVWDGDYYG